MAKTEKTTNMKLIIAGSRSINDYGKITKALAFFNIKPKDIKEVVSGCAKGIDSLAIKWANNNGVKVVEMPANWKDLKAEPCHIKENSYGKYNALAGLARNVKMGEYSDAVLAIWDGKSTGTLHMISYMEEQGKKVFVYEL